jgi:glycerol-3-phosphate dehydrogenase
MTASEVLAADVAVIGAGVVGTAIALRLSRLDLSVVVIERRHDIGDATSKSNSGITASGWTLPASSLEARLVTASSPRWEDLTDRLGVEYRRCGMVGLCRDDDEVRQGATLVENSRRNGVEAHLLVGQDLLAVAPHANPAAKAGVYVPTEGVIDSVRLPIAYAKLAALNGVRFFLDEPVIAAENDGHSITELVTPRRRFRPRFVVNSAGLGADQVSRLLGSEDFVVGPRRGQWLLLDRDFGAQVPCVLTGMPTERTHGVMVIPTAHGSVMLGPTAEDIADKDDRGTDADTIHAVLSECRALMPAIDERQVIKTFAGVRSHSVPTYRIERSAHADNLVTVAGIRSTGVSGSPGIADYVAELLIEAGLPAREKSQIVERLGAPLPLRISRDCASSAEDPLGRTVVCTCEKVTAAEIHWALQDPIGARSIGGIARRTHATWGRCQGSACLSGVSFIASLYLGTEAWQVPVGEASATLGVAQARRV